MDIHILLNILLKHTAFSLKAGVFLIMQVAGEAVGWGKRGVERKTFSMCATLSLISSVVG